MTHILIGSWHCVTCLIPHNKAMECASFSSAKVIDHTLVIVIDFSNPYISNQPFQASLLLTTFGEYPGVHHSNQPPSVWQKLGPLLAQLKCQFILTCVNCLNVLHFACWFVQSSTWWLLEIGIWEVPLGEYLIHTGGCKWHIVQESSGYADFL